MSAHVGPILTHIAGGLPLAASAGERVIHPVLIIVLCVIAGVATILLLPGRREPSIRNIGGAVLAAALLILAALMMRKSAGVHFYFWVFSLIALGGAVRVITHPRPVYSALYFVLTVFASAGLFVLLWAEFMAAALVLIYAGAILVTYVFVIMLASQPAEDGAPASSARAALAEYDAVSREPVVAATVGFTLMGLLLFVIFDKADTIAPNPVSPEVIARAGQGAQAGGTQRLAAALFDDQLVNLELAGLILTVAMVGAIIIARRRILVAEPGGAGAPETLVAPATPVDDNPFSIPVTGTDNPRQKAYPEN